jgi:hypothetical protein
MAEHILDSTDFSTVNASTNTLIAGALPQAAIDFYNPTIVVNTWYRYYESIGLSPSVNESGGVLILNAIITTPHNGIIQQLSNLTIGRSYDIEIDYSAIMIGSARVLIYSGTTLKSTHDLALGVLSQTITFIATTTEDTLVIDTEFTTVTNLLMIDTINVIATRPQAPYLTGYAIKPDTVTSLGEVFFTDGTNTGMRANQVTCEAYGYTYNIATGTCNSFRYNTNLESTINNINNTNNGAGNTNQLGSNTIQINGTQNTTRGFNNNCLINGNRNEIANSVNNATVFGTRGEATATNSTVLGCTESDSLLGFKQSMHLMYGRQTITSGWSASYLNNTTGSFLNVPDNTAMYFHAEVLAVRIGGTAVAGAPGDFASWVERGVIINKSGVTSIVRERDTIKSSGTVTGWLTTSAVSGSNTNFLLNVKGAANVTIEWAGNIRFTQIKTGVAL